MKIANRIIVVEGTDGVGKSTLAKSLADYYGCQYLWLGRPEKGEAFEFYMRAYVDQIHNSWVILDRSHYSEEVYGSIFRDGSEFTTSQRELLNALIGTARPMLIQCVLDKEIIVENQAQAPDDDHHGEDPTKVQDKYFEVLVGSGYPVMLYNYTIETPAKLANRIESSVSHKY